MGNPTVEALEHALAQLEGGCAALACASGMAAIHTTFAGLLQAGDHAICSSAVYGPTCTLLETIMKRFDIESTIIDTSDLELVKRAVRSNTRMILVETPGNPTLVISDIEAIAKIAHSHGAVLVVDNTFMSPILQRPFEFGADIVVHSLTKFLNGHADVVGGAIIVRTDEHYGRFRTLLNHLGGVLPPLESFLVHRGIKTLTVRMQRHCANAMEVARFLEVHPAVEWTRYPGLPSHPQFRIAKKQMSGFGGLIAFELKGGVPAGATLMDGVELCSLAVSLGGVETLIEHPASMTHASIGTEARRRAGISDGLVRLSVGIESAQDIIADLDAALTRVAELGEAVAGP
jgi:methionine-gamma-lyase